MGVEEAWKAIRQDHYDLRAWNAVIQDAEQRPVNEARAMYEEVLRAFPKAWWVWYKYAEAEINQKERDDETVQAIFSRCLLECKFLDLWHLYLDYIRTVHGEGDESGAKAIREAYEFAVEHVGQDPRSGQLWTDYINFLRRVRADYAFTTPRPGQEESMRMMEIRKAFKQALVVPQNSIDSLWKEYEAFEHQVSPKLAKPLLEELKPKVNVARSVFDERKRLNDCLPKRVLAGPPRELPDGWEWAASWRKYLAFERKNTQRVDESILISRVSLAYDQCLCCLTLFPEMWLEYVGWLEKRNCKQQAAEVCERAAHAVPTCTALRLLHADILEALDNNDQAEESLERLILDVERQAVIESDVDQNGDEPNAAEGGPEEAEQENARQKELYDQLALAYIQYMRFARRVRGREQARKVFSKARKVRQCRWQVFAAAADLERRYEGDTKVPCNIFELGLKRYGSCVEFILHYVDFLKCVNDNANARALFERALELVPKSRKKEIWDRFVRFEHENGELPSIQQVEQRRKEALGNMVETSAEVTGVMLSRYRLFDLIPCISDQKDHFRELGGLSASMVSLSQPLSGGSLPPDVQTNDDQRNLQLQADEGGEDVKAEPAGNGEGDADLGTSQEMRKGVAVEIPEGLELFLESLPPAEAVPQPAASADAVLRAAADAELTPAVERATVAAIEATRPEAANRSDRKRSAPDNDTTGEDNTSKRQRERSGANIFELRHQPS